MDFTTIWKRCETNLFNFILSKTNDAALAHDILQEVSIKLHNALVRKVEIRNHTSWLYQVARNTISDHYRSQNISKTQMASLPNRNASESCICDLSGFIIQNYLPQKYSHALYLSDIEELPQQQIAKQMGLSLTATKSRIQRGRQKLRELVTKCVNIEWNSRGEPVDYYLKNSCELPPELLKEIKKINLTL
ncbi:sigma-70 family RNA polymerase sigma factor [Fulvivirga sp. 29W222]|uniref:Sigma-70 family RNA polymerase sigma factor n=1 Tax=Fulvivirga marina TaxID=2494733 RepID=A0A937G7Q5_9BACT|nr:sigma-70 family RNA polymerase sigma factor [Fulvivirga marina]MBL6449951.1 sigma-70 family RNA polymerase sigma factor [Fulvivirga marina]